MTKAYFQALAYGQESRERQELANKALDCYGPMLRDFILGQGCFSQAEQIQAARRVGEKIAEKAKKAINEQFAKEFNDHKANAVVEVPIPQKKNPMPHAWSSDPDRDAKVRMEEDGRTKPYRTLTELLRDEGAVVSKSDPLMAAREQLEVANNAQLAAARERDRADEARARYRKRWQERGRTIAKLQARLHERKASGVNSTLAGWCRVVQSQRTEAVSHAAACRKEVFGLRKLVSDYEDRVGELNLKVNRLEGDLDLAVQSHANATERRLKAEARVAELEAVRFGAALPKVVADMAAEIKRLDAERDEAKQRHLRECEKCSALADKVIGLKARVAELESAPAASGAAGKEVGVSDRRIDDGRLIAAVRILARDIQSGDSCANACLLEVASRLAELVEERRSISTLLQKVETLEAALAEKASVTIPPGWMNRERDSQWIATLEKVGIEVKGVEP